METAKVGFSETLQHQNGLVTRKPQGFRAEPNPTGFEFFEVQQLRNPTRISLSLLPFSTTPPHIPRAWFGVFGLRYRITEEPGGSGGTLYNFETSKAYGSCWVLLRATQQSEDGPPSFLVAWAVLQKTAIHVESEAARNCSKSL